MRVETISGNRFYPVLAQSYIQMNCKIPAYVSTNDRLIKLAHPVDSVVKSESIKYLYLAESDLLGYTQQVIKQNKLSESASGAIVQLAERTQLALWGLQQQGVNHQNYFLLENIAQSIVALGTNHKISELFSQIPSGDAQKYLIRTFLAKLLCYKLQFTSEATLYKITLSSLLCDVGLYAKDLGTTTHQEKSVEILQTLKIPGDVAQIILHHHEYNDGSGPLKVSRHRIHPLAKVLRVTDEFTDILFTQKIDKNTILQQLYANCPKKFDQNLVRALDLCFKS
jgi:hypothetical protein